MLWIQATKGKIKVISVYRIEMVLVRSYISIASINYFSCNRKHEEVKSKKNRMVKILLA
jgi:hypothetical protein